MLAGPQPIGAGCLGTAGHPAFWLWSGTWDSVSLMGRGDDSWGHPAMRVKAAHLLPGRQVLLPGLSGGGGCRGEGGRQGS